MRILLIISAIGMMLSCQQRKDIDNLYLNPDIPVEQRVEDLLSKMTLKEKIAQMNQFVGLEHMASAEQDISIDEMEKSHARGFYPGLTIKDVEEMTKNGEIGSFLHVVTAKEANYLQSLAQQSKLKIPLIIGIDAIHGNGLVSGSTIYPTPIGQAASFDPELVELSSKQTALEMRKTGSHWSFTPNVEVARDARWGRVGETFGEDPYLISVMGASTVRGLQSPSGINKNSVLACAKHLVGGSQPLNGINGAPCDISDRTLHEVFLPPFEACINEDVYTVMTAHNELNGVPCHGNKYLMTDILRDRWNFKGFIVSDWMDIERMHDYHTIAPTLKDAYRISVESGMDLHMHGPDFADKLLELVNENVISEKRIDESVRKILAAKFNLGLFENPYVELSPDNSTVFSEEHQQTALEMARKGIVLLKNEGLLPINNNKFKKVLITGPNADNQSILGDWALEQPDNNVITIVEGLKNVSPETKFEHVAFDWDVRKLDNNIIKQAEQKAKECDLAIVIVGETSQRYYWNDKTCGENSDRYDINLPGNQQELVEKIYSTGVPTIVVLVNGRPLSTEWIANNIPAVIEAWEPGAMGGQALAEIIYGKVNPSAKLPITIPRHAGQIPCYYNHKFTHHWFPYATGDSSPLYHFGHGLSYTDFDISDIKLSSPEMSKEGKIIATVTVTNTGKMKGDEVVQMYIQDKFSQVTRPVKELKGFQRVTLEPNESKNVTFTIDSDMLAFYNLNMQKEAESGDFNLYIGSSSKDSDLKKTLFTLK